MKRTMIQVLVGFCWAMMLTGCSTGGQTTLTTDPELVRLFPRDDQSKQVFEGNITTSPLLDLSHKSARVLLALSDGTVAALDAQTGLEQWRLTVPAPPQRSIFLMATPVRIKHKLVVTYQTLYKGKRDSHRVVVIDLVKGQLDARYPILELRAEKPLADGSGTVLFDPVMTLSHSDLVHASHSGSKMGFVYVSFGNGGDIQPFHGWVFELDMDAWLNSGTDKAISASLLTTPENYCPEAGKTGSQDMICGGGVWTPAGPQVYQKGGHFELIVPVGNGQFDLTRRDYAGTLMRTQRGLVFDPGCDARLCAGFDPVNPDQACMQSCKNLFIPRLMSGDPPLRPASGVCDQKTFWECMMWNDFDLGANAPVKVDLSGGISVLVQPGKEGGLYLLDADHLGIQYDRKQMLPLCGAPKDKCARSWAGMVVTQPVLTELEGDPVVIVPTFMPDKTHSAGLFAYKIIHKQGKPQLQYLWQAPDRASKDVLKLFRSHPSRAVVAPFSANGESYVWVVNINKHGTILGVRVRDGKVVGRTQMLGTGRPLSLPLLYNDVIYAPVNRPGQRYSWLEAYKISQKSLVDRQAAEI